MKTEKIMIRDLSGNEIRQNHKSGMLNANDILNAYQNITGSKKLLPNYLRLQETKDFIQEICYQENLIEKEVKQTKSGKNGGTWFHPALFVDFAMWLSPEFKYQVIKWVTDGLLNVRDGSGDSFKLMNNVLAECFPDILDKPYSFVKISNSIANACKVGVGKNRWERASKEQLAKRDKIQSLVAHFSSLTKSPIGAVNMAIKSVEEMEQRLLKQDF